MLSSPLPIVLDTSVVSILIRRAVSATYYQERAATALLLECPIVSHDRDLSDIPDLAFIRVP